MNKLKLRRKLAAGALVVTAALAGGGAATAFLAGGPSATASTAVTTSTTYSASTPPEPASSPLQQLVDDGTITQAQATSVRAAFYQYMRGEMRNMGDMAMTGPQGIWTSVLAQLVNEGTISPAQATAITDAMAWWAGTHRNGTSEPSGTAGSMMGRGGSSMMGGGTSMR